MAKIYFDEHGWHLCLFQIFIAIPPAGAFVQLVQWMPPVPTKDLCAIVTYDDSLLEPTSLHEWELMTVAQALLEYGAEKHTGLLLFEDRMKAVYAVKCANDKLMTQASAIAARNGWGRR